ncbi:MAG TPA: response regulator [Candidatus Acidoferrales bacterium]|nr:response regulator [Candidatus Acidoferrales bacterium]
MKILIVDCDPAILQFLETFLREEGNDVTAVLYDQKDCARRIVELARAQPFQAAFINPFMPDLSGVELSGRIKNVSPHTRIILMSTPAPPATRAHLLSHGVATEFFIEPSALQELREILGSPRQEQPAPLEGASGTGAQSVPY